MSEASAPGGGNILNPGGRWRWSRRDLLRIVPTTRSRLPPEMKRREYMGTRKWPKIFPMASDDQTHTSDPKRVRSDFLGECRRALVRVTSLKNGDVITKPPSPEESRKLQT